MQEAINNWNENGGTLVPELKDRTIANNFVVQYIKYKEAIVE